MYIYCLFCETGKSKYIMRAAEDLYGCRALSPKQVQHTWTQGRMTDIVRDLLPGYVFLYFADALTIPGRLQRIPGVIRCLRDSAWRYELQGHDEQFALMLLKKEGTIGKTQVYQENDRIRLKEGAFAGLQATIMKVDRRNSRMMIEIPFASRLVKTWIEYEVVEPEENERLPYRTGGEKPDGEEHEHG